MVSIWMSKMDKTMYNRSLGSLGSHLPDVASSKLHNTSSRNGVDWWIRGLPSGFRGWSVAKTIQLFSMEELTTRSRLKSSVAGGEAVAYPVAGSDLSLEF